MPSLIVKFQIINFVELKLTKDSLNDEKDSDTNPIAAKYNWRFCSEYHEGSDERWNLYGHTCCTD